MKGNLLPEVFNSPTFGQLDWQETIGRMVKFMASDTSASYEVIVGTDSQATDGDVDFVSALVVHRKGRGGVYFWGRQNFQKLHSLRQRIWQEALISLAVAEKLVSEFVDIGLIESGQPAKDFNLEIHVDIGPNGPTREMIADIVGMIRANGFAVATKPASWGASHVADRHV